MIWIGTSGYNYPEWKGSFYPSDLPAAKMLPYYAARFPTVEINYTFYRMPNEKLVGGWAAQTPDAYKLTLKAPRRITHDSRLKNCAELVDGFCRVAGTLGPKLGALLFQLPPNLKKDLALFDAFLNDLPPKAPAAFEFRHTSWLDDDVFERLKARNLALVHRGQREAVDAGHGDGRLRVLSASRRGLHARRHWTVGRDHRSRNDAPAATCSSTSSTKKRGRGRSSARLLGRASRVWRESVSR